MPHENVRVYLLLPSAVLSLLLSGELGEADLRIATATDNAVREYARTANAILKQCVSRYRAMGEAATGHADDARTCREAWTVTALALRKRGWAGY